LADAGCMLVLFSGGEPFVRPDAFELFNYAKKAGLQIVINTNATLLDAAKIQKLKDLSPTLLSISVYGITQPTYESITGVRGSFAKFMAGLEKLRDYPHPLIFKMPVMTRNVHELAAAKQWFHERNWRFIHSVEIHPKVDGDLSPLTVRLPAEEAARLRFQYDELTRCGGYGGETKDLDHRAFDCQCGKNSLAVTPYGEMNLCVTTSYPKYSLKTGSVKEGWNLMVNFVENFRPSSRHECPSCELASFCSQGSMDAWLNTGDFNPCLPYFKEVAGLIKIRKQSTT
jgi:radical SAM protein with 4Fe4S-binding SPASM domain